MFNMSKRTLTALAVGTIITTGTSLPFFTKVANANETMMSPPIQKEMQQDHKRNMQRPPRNERRMFFPGIEEELGISKTAMDVYCQNGHNPRDVIAAALVAKTANTSLDNILNYKSQNKSWNYIMNKYDISFYQVRQTRNQLAAKVIATHTGANKIVIDRLFKEGYRDHDIMMAAELSKLSSKSVIQVITMKKINNTWYDVVSDLGLNDTIIKKDMGPLY